MILNQRMSPSLSEKQLNQQAEVCLQKGFTLLELMIVVSILGVLLAIAIPRFQEWREHASVNNATSALFVTLKKARTLAVAESRSVKVTLKTTDPYSFTYDSAGCSNCQAKKIELKQFSSNLQLKRNGGTDSFTFSSRGTSGNGTIKIENGTYYKCITINAIGRAYVQDTSAPSATCQGL